MLNDSTLELDDLRTPTQLAAEYPHVLTVAMLRLQLRRRAKNGLAACCVPMGRRLMISKSRYQAWLAGRLGAPLKP